MAIDQKNEWTPNRNEAIKALIRETISASGMIAPDQLPHHIRNQLKGQIEGTVNLDQIIADVMAEEKRKNS